MYFRGFYSPGYISTFSFLFLTHRDSYCRDPCLLVPCWSGYGDSQRRAIGFFPQLLQPWVSTLYCLFFFYLCKLAVYKLFFKIQIFLSSEKQNQKLRMSQVWTFVCVFPFSKPGLEEHSKFSYLQLGSSCLAWLYITLSSLQQWFQRPWGVASS